MSAFRILWHIPFLVFLIVALFKAESTLLQKNEPLILIILTGVLFLALIVPMSYLLIQYLLEDWNKTVEIKGSNITIKKGSYFRELNLNTDIISSASIKSGGFRNLLVGYGFFRFQLISGETILITSLMANPKKIAQHFQKPGKELTVGFPRIIGLSLDGKGEELADSLTNKIKTSRDKYQKESFDANVSRFLKKFENKSVDELRTIVVKNDLAEYVIEACRILIQQKRN